MIEKSIHQSSRYRLIVTIVKKGLGSKVVTVSKKAGAQGGTIILGRGTADKSISQKLLGIDYEPEKEIVLTLIQQEYMERVFDAIIQKMQLNKPGKGIIFLIDVKNFIGITHLLHQDLKEV